MCGKALGFNFIERCDEKFPFSTFINMSVDFRNASINVCYVSPVFCHPISQIDRFTNIIVGTSFTGQNIIVVRI